MTNKKNQRSHKKADKEWAHKRKNTPSPKPTPKPQPKPKPAHKKTSVPPVNHPDKNGVPNDILLATQGLLGLAGQDITDLPTFADNNSQADDDGVPNLDCNGDKISPSEEEDSSSSSDGEGGGTLAISQLRLRITHIMDMS
jgi:outer membrane biosynthesis protein TonB